MNVPPMVVAIVSLRSSLPPVSDELRKRVQSIRVRSIPETPGSRPALHGQGHSQAQAHSQDRNNWRNRPSSNTVQRDQPNHWRQAAPASVPFRFTNSDRVRPQAPQESMQNAHNVQHLQRPSSPWSATGSSRYVSKFHNGSKAGDEKILHTIILNKLNIFSIKTYDDVKQFLFQILGSDQKEFTREFTWMVFRKAAAEEKFCSLYARLLSEIKKEYPVILEEMRKLHTTYLDIWKVADSPDSSVDKRYRLGYSQFLAELTTLGVLELDTMKTTLETLRSCILECIPVKEQAETIEEYTNCLKQLCNSKSPIAVKNIFREVLVKDMTQWIDMSADKVPGLSSRSRFALMDLVDLLVKK